MKVFSVHCELCPIRKLIAQARVNVSLELILSIEFDCLYKL